MSTEQNARAVRRWIEEVMSQGRLEVIEEVLAHSVRFGGRQATETSDAHRRVRAYVLAYRAAFPDLTVTIDDLVPSDDAVTICWTSRGTNTGHFSHPDIQSFGLAPTGRAARWGGISFFRLAEGRIVESRTHSDVYSLLRQLQLVPPPGNQSVGS